jgi:hypothetical protein
MFTHRMRRYAPVHIRIAFARARVKSARICRLTEPLKLSPPHENRFEI